MKNSAASSFREFKPALRFLFVFVGAYVAGNILYGLYIEFYKPAPDPVTISVTFQSAFLLNTLSAPAHAVISPGEPVVLLNNQDRTIIRVFEGCNGLNVMIVFGAFIIAFRGNGKEMLLFFVSGCLVLHLANLVRVGLLFQSAIHRPVFFYYFHKYFFTAILYAVVFALWYMWVERIRVKTKKDGTVKA